MLQVTLIVSNLLWIWSIVYFMEVNFALHIFLIGAILLAAVYYTAIYLFVRVPMLLNYSLYLWCSVINFTIVVVFFDQINRSIESIPAILNAFVYSISLLLYIRFIVSIFNINKQEFKVEWFFTRIAYALVAWSAIYLNVCRYLHQTDSLGFKLSNAFAAVFLFVWLGYMFLVLFRKKRSVFHTFVLYGMVSALVAIILLLLELIRAKDGVSNSTNYYLLGFFIEILFFSLAMGAKFREAVEERAAAIKQVADNQQILLAAELERENAVFAGRIHERRRIAAEMHDGLNGSLATLKHYIEHIKMGQQDADMRETLQHIEDEVLFIYSQTRGYTHQLFKEIDSAKFDLIKMLQMLEMRFRQGSVKILVDADLEKIRCLLSFQQQDGIYLIIKECISNILKHAQASEIQISFLFKDQQCHLCVTDNGKGFDLDSAPAGLGLASMEQRMADLGGVLRIARINELTQVHAIMKLNQEG